MSVTSRSIKLDDINYVTGFSEPDFKTYIFGTENNFARQEVDYYYPSEAGASNTENPYWVKATDTSEDHSDSKDFECNTYYYYKNGDEYKFSWEGTDWDLETTTLSKSDNMKYVIGEDGNSAYVVASRSVYVAPNFADIYVARVGSEGVRGNGYVLCRSSSNSTRETNSSLSVSVRPVVVLPSSICVEKRFGGTYALARFGRVNYC